GKAVGRGKRAPKTAARVDQNNVGDVEILVGQALAGDPSMINPFTGRVVLEVNGRIAGGGLVLSIDSAETAEKGSVHYVRTAEDVLNRVTALVPRLAGLSPADRLALLREEVAGKIIFTTSFGIEDQIILHMINDRDLDVEVVTLDTGRLFPETYELWARTEEHFGRRIRAIYPRRGELETLVEEQGINGFYKSREARTACCFVRKVEPLNR